MIFRRHPNLLKTVVPQLLLILAVSVLVVATHGHVFGLRIRLYIVPFPLVGVSLAIFLAVRNHAAYVRCVEACQIWDRILVAARALTAQVANSLPADGDGFERKLLVQRLIAFVHALTHQLRGTDPSDELARCLPREEVEQLRGAHYVPAALLDRIRLMLSRAGRKRGDGEPLMGILDAQVSELAAAVAGCERIAPQPIRFAHSVLLRRTVYLYCCMLPFGLVGELGMATPVVSVFAACTLFALLAIAQEISGPFGANPNCVELSALHRLILEYRVQAV